MANFPCSAVILAGGEAKRLKGVSKARLQVGGQRLLDRLLAVLEPLFDEVILVTTDPVAYLKWDLLIVSDHYNQRSSLTGIHAGLFAARHPHALVTACDMPFVQRAMVETLLRTLEPGWDVIIPQTAKGFEPLLAIYSKRCLSPIEQRLASGHYRVQSIFRQVRVNPIHEDVLRRHDPELVSFFNINSPDDLARAEARLRGTAPATE